MRRIFKTVWFKLTYASVVILAFWGIQPPYLSLAYPLAKWILIILGAPLAFKLCFTFWRLLPYGAKIYRNHPQWRRCKN